MTITPITRRSFLNIASLTIAGASMPVWAKKGAPASIGVQLYTVRKEVQSDLPGTLAALRKIGFNSVESFNGMYSRPAAELRSVVEDSGLKLPSAIFAYDQLEERVAYAADLGVQYMVCNMLPKPLWSRDGFIQAAAQFNRVGALAKSANIAFCFHNHNFEFQPQAPTSETGLEILLGQTDPAVVHWEEDCYWVAQAGLDPLKLLQQHKSRVAILHLKDRKPEATPTFDNGKGSQFFTEIGTGTINWTPILRIARAAGKPMFVEQDVTSLPALESLTISYKNLQKYLA